MADSANTTNTATESTATSATPATPHKLSGALLQVAGSLTKSLHLQSSAVPANVESTLAPALQGIAKTLDRKFTANTLSSKLESRPDMETLHEYGVVKESSSIAPRIQSVKRALEHNMIKDTLSHLLAARPTLEEFEALHIVPHSEQSVSAKIASAASKLQQAFTANQLSHLLATRPDVDQVQDVVQNDGRVAPSLRATSKKLEFEFSKNKLNQLLATRPSAVEVYERGIFSPPQPHPSLVPEYDDEDYDDEDQDDDDYEQDQYQGHYAYTPANTQNFSGIIPQQQDAQSRNFVLTRLLLKLVAHFAAHGLITLDQKGCLKDLIVDQHTLVLAAAEVFELDQDLFEMLDTLKRICARFGF